MRLGSKLDAIMTDDPDLRRSKEERSYAINDYRGLWTIDDSAYSDYGEIGLPKAQERMDLLHDLLQRHGIGMTLVVYPWPDQILHVDADSLQVRVWRAWARRHAVPFINLFPDFIRNGQDPKQAIRQYFIPGDVHWNEEGHRLVAARFLEGWERPHPTQSQTRASGHRTPS